MGCGLSNGLSCGLSNGRQIALNKGLFGGGGIEGNLSYYLAENYFAIAGITNSIEKLAVRKFFHTAIRRTYFPKLAVLYLVSPTSRYGASINAIMPAGTKGIVQGSATFSKNGISGTTTALLQSHLFPGSTGFVNNMSIGVYSRTNILPISAGTETFLCGSYTGGAGLYTVLMWSDGRVYFDSYDIAGGGRVFTGAPSDTLGYHQINRTASNSANYSIRGVNYLANASVAGTANATVKIAIGGATQVAGASPKTMQICGGHIGYGFTNTESAQFYADMQEYQRTVIDGGRHV